MSIFRRPRHRWPSIVAPLIAMAALTCKETGVTDTPVAVSTIDVNPATIALSVGQRQTITATPKSASGKSLTARQVQWSSSATNIAVVDATGSVQGITAGSASITATSGGATNQVAVTVTNPTFTLTVTGGGNGNGTVTSNPAGISCIITNGVANATGCSASFTLGTSVTLTATPASGNTLAAWTGSCNTATGASCTIVMSTNRAVGVQFTRPAAPLAVSTDAADQITNSSARLNGTVNQDGSPYTTWFQFGTSPTLTPFNITAGGNSGSRTDCPGTSACPWNDRITGLQPNTTYFFRIVAENTAGQVVGAIRSFTTASNAAAPTISALSETVVALNSTTCTFTSGPNGSSYSHTFSFTDPNGDVAFTGTPVIVTFVGQPSGTNGSLSTSVSSSSGTGGSGAITLGLCWRFGTDASINYTVQLRDAAGNTSNTLSRTIARPAGANSAGQASARLETP